MKRTRPKLRISCLSGVTTEPRILAFRYLGTTSGVVILGRRLPWISFSHTSEPTVVAVCFVEKERGPLMLHILMNGNGRRMIERLLLECWT
jgi:hypothetical protein